MLRNTICLSVLNKIEPEEICDETVNGTNEYQIKDSDTYSNTYLEDHSNLKILISMLTHSFTTCRDHMVFVLNDHSIQDVYINGKLEISYSISSSHDHM